MVCCAALGCKNNTKKKRLKNESEKRISFFKFPRDPVMNELWVQMLRRSNWTSTPNSRLCSDHFAKDQIWNYPSGLHLRDGAVPSIFPFPQIHSTKSKKQKKTRIEDSSLDSTGFLVVEVIQLGNAEDGNLSRNEPTQIENPKLKEITQQENPLLAKMRAALAKAQKQSTPSSHKSSSSSNMTPSAFEEFAEVEVEDLNPSKTVEHSAEEPINQTEVESDSSSDVEITGYPEVDDAISHDEAETISHEAESIIHEDETINLETESIAHEDKPIDLETESNNDAEAEAEMYNSQSEPEIISHGEAECMLSQCIEWFEQQPEADSSQLSLLKKIRDMAASKALDEHESERI